MNLAKLALAALVPCALLASACSAAPGSEIAEASGEALTIKPKPGPVQGGPGEYMPCNASASTIYEECSGNETPIGSGSNCVCMPWCGGKDQLGCASTGNLADREGCNQGFMPAFTWVDDNGSWKEEGATCVTGYEVTGNINVLFAEQNSQNGSAIVGVEATTSGAGNVPFMLSFTTPDYGPNTVMGPFRPLSTGPTGAFENFTVPACTSSVTVTISPYLPPGSLLQTPLQWAQKTISIPQSGPWSVGGGECCIQQGVEMPCSGVTVVSGSSGGGGGSSSGGGGGSSGGGGPCATVSCYYNDAVNYLGQFCDLEDAQAFESQQGGEAGDVYCM